MENQTIIVLNQGEAERYIPSDFERMIDMLQKVRFSAVDDVREFVKAAAKCDFDVDISDPDAFKPVDRTFYFFVDKEVETETSNSLSLEFELPTKNDSEIVSFDLR